MSKKTQVILLLALLLVILLFGVSVALGSRSGQQVSLAESNATQLSAWLSRPVKAGQLTPAPGNLPGCRLENGQILLTPGQDCAFSLMADRLWTLKLRLVLAIPQGPNPMGILQPVIVRLEQTSAFPIEQNLVPNGTPVPIELDIFSQQTPAAATLVIHAPDGAPGAEGYNLEVVEK